MDFEYIIVGGGVIGLACAMQLSKSSSSVLLIERHSNFGAETSSRNSEVIHAGIYYPEGTLKAKLCVAGNKSIYEWCIKSNVPVKKIGKFIIAVNKEEDNELFRIRENAHKNGASNVDFYDIQRFKIEEPNIKASSVLWSPDTGIVDSHKLMESYKNCAEENDASIAFNHTLKSISKVFEGYKLEIESGGETFEVTSEKVINSAGLNSDIIAGMVGINITENNYNLHYVKGNYFRLKSSKRNLTRHLIYPVPIKNFSGLGVHITIDMNGELKFGPDVEYLESKDQNYDVNTTLNVKFFDAINQYVIGIELEDIYADQSGIRPKLQGKGESFRDFIIKEESNLGFPGFVNLIGIESPGLTCSLEIAKMVESFFVDTSSN